MRVATPRASGTGTAFSVSPDGYLITCAHVVHGATKITVQFDSKTYEAEVISYDSESDLAILKIDAEDLPHLAFCDSDKVQLAQEVRAVGYPLSDMLGESVKMSRGTISGIIKREDENRFQIDARVNPGNSGGPLVDEQGRAVGVASELLTNEKVDSIGFAIPGNEALRLLREKSISAVLAPDGPEFKGPELAKRVTPAVAIVKVEIGPGGFGVKKMQVLQFRGFYDGRGRYRSPSTDESGKLVVDSSGRIHSYEGRLMVPFSHESLGTVGIERLPDDGRTKWSSFRFIVLKMVSSPDSSSSRMPFSGLPYSGFLPPHLRPPFAPGYRPPYDRYRSPLRPPFFRSQPQAEIIPAVEQIQYQRLSTSSDGTVKISKKYQLCSVNAKKDGTGRLNMETAGTLTWDKEIGGVRRCEMKGQVAFSSKNVTVRIPIELTYHVEKKKPEPPQPGAKADMADGSNSRPPVRKVEPSDAAVPPSSLKQAPSSTGLSKFNPDD